MLAIVTEVLAHGGASVRCQELEGSGVRGGGSNDDAVAHCPLFVELPDKLSDGGTLLANANINAREGIRLGLLVDDGINRNGGLTGLTITDDQLTLTTTDGDEGVHGLEAGKHGLGHGLARDDAGGLDLRTGALAVVEADASIDGLADAVHNAAKELVADGDVDDGAGTLDSVPLEDVNIVTEDDNSHVALLEVEGHAAETASEDHHLTGLDIGEAVDAGDTITNGDDRAISAYLTAESSDPATAEILASR